MDIYQCFSALAQRCAPHVTREQLWLEYDIPLTASLTEPGIPDTLSRLFECAPAIVARIELEVGGVTVRFVRTSGHEPFRKSMFDTIELIAVGPLTIDDYELRGALLDFSECLDVVLARGSGMFARMAAELSLASTHPAHDPPQSSSRSMS